MIAWTLVERSISDLKPNPNNPRCLSKAQAEQLKISLKKFGLIDRPIINLDNSIIGGHQRILLCEEATIECWMPHRQLTKEEADEISIRLNRNTGSWDYDILANQWDVDQLIEWGFQERDLFEEREKKSVKSRYQVTLDAVSREELQIIEDKIQQYLPEHEYKLKIKEAK